MYSTQAWAAHYGLPLNTPDEFIQGYVDAMRLDAKGQGKPCGRGFIPKDKKCSTKGRQQLAQDLRSGDLGAKARVAKGRQNAMAQQAARRIEKNNALVDRRMAEETQKNAERNAGSQSKRKRSPEAIEKGKETRAANKAKQQALWGSKANTPKRLQRETVKIEEGKVHRTRAIKGRSSKSAQLRQGKGLEGVSERAPQTEQTKSKRKRSPEAIEKQKATRTANKAAKAARREALQGTLDKPGRIKRTRRTTERRNEQIGRATGSRTSRARRGVSGVRVAN
jgi:hypothetical protein